MFWNKKERRLYNQIEEFFRFKCKYSDHAANEDREWLYKLAKFVDAQDITEITADDIEFFLEYYKEHYTPYSILRARKALRCFLRYHRSRGYPLPVQVESI